MKKILLMLSLALAVFEGRSELRIQEFKPEYIITSGGKDGWRFTFTISGLAVGKTNLISYAPDLNPPVQWFAMRNIIATNSTETVVITNALNLFNSGAFFRVQYPN